MPLLEKKPSAFRGIGKSRLLGDQRGMALIVALGTLTVLSISAFSLLYYTTRSEVSAQSSSASTRAYALAEAGTNDAISVLANSSDPSSSSALPASEAAATATNVTGGSYKYWGVLSGTTWTITGKGTINATGETGAVSRSVSRQVLMNSVSVGSFGGLWDRVYSDATGACSITLNNGMNIPSPFAAKGDVCLNASSKLTGSTVDIGGKVTLGSGGSGSSIGTSGTNISQANIAGTCKYGSATAHSPCSSADHVYANSYTTSPQNLTRPTIDWQYWYDNAAPGPKHPCTTSTGTPPAFDSNTTYDGGNADKEITPEGSGKSYTCQAKDANGNVIGELSWDNVARVLTIKGTIFFDGKATFGDHDTGWHYRGRGVIYISKDWHNDESVCAGSATTDCRTTGMPTWNTNTDLLVLVIGGKNGAGEDFAFHRINSAFQGAIYAVHTCNIHDTAYMQGPINCGAFDFAGDSPSFFAWPPLPNSTPGQIYTTGTNSDLQLVLGNQTG